MTTIRSRETRRASGCGGMNTPNWFNKRDSPKTAAGEYFIDDIRLQTPGFRVGGPILQNKAFYFGNVEWFSWPNSASRIRYFLKQDAAQRHLPLPRQQRQHAGAEPARARGVKRADVDRRSDAREAVRGHPDGGGYRRRHRQRRRTQPREVQLQPHGQPVAVLPDRPHRLQPDSGPPDLGRVPLEPFRRPAGRAERQ